MVKIILVLCISIMAMHANIYESNCVSCHKKLPVSIDKYFYRYLLKYSSQQSVKKAMMAYLKQPQEKTTIMPEAFISRFGIKKPTKLSDEDLEEAIETYWDTYKIFGKLK